MRLKFIILALSAMIFTSCNGGVVVISLGGASRTVIHDVVEECAREYGYTLTLGENWLQDGGEAVVSDSDAERIRDAINTLVSLNGGDKSDLALLVVGKSSGGVLAWDTFRLHYADIDDFHRAALVMVDPHGSVLGDGEAGPYCQRQDLWWPDGWSSDTDFFRVYNIYQHERWFTGASFPDERVYSEIQLSGNGIDHSSITSHTRTCELIQEGLHFALTGE